MCGLRLIRLFWEIRMMFGNGWFKMRPSIDTQSVFSDIQYYAVFPEPHELSTTQEMI